MKPRIIDTNVTVVSNGRTENADPDCVIASIEALRDAQQTGPVLIDDADRILDEYKPYFAYSGQPGPGDRFFRWLMLNLANPSRCLRIQITPTEGDTDNFEEFPNDPDLARFDRSDRKFVAVARASGLDPTVVNAVDTDWWHFRDNLAKHGVLIEFVCPQHMQ